mgnify:FL=1
MTRLGARKAEMVQAIFVLIFASWATLAVVGVFLRGPGMALVWPWG